MLPAIDLDDQPPFAADKIDHIWPNALLAHELRACDLSRAQAVPQPSFGIGRVEPQLARTGDSR
jgi:hypothetical protein